MSVSRLKEAEVGGGGGGEGEGGEGAERAEHVDGRMELL